MRDNELCWCKSGKFYCDCHKQFDIILNDLRRKGKVVPERRLIKNVEQIEGIRKAGKVNSMVLDEVEKNIREGMTTQQIDDIVSECTKDLGGIPAPLGYEGYPKSVCTSVNDQVCHGIPSNKVILKSGDIVNVDCTTIVDGYYGDASRMFIIGEASEDAKKLVRVTKECLDLATSKLQPFCHLGDIGYFVSKHARENGFSVVEEVGGHGVGLQMHEDPYVCHVGKYGKGMVLTPGMVFTIEPMINQGSRHIFVDNSDGWTIYTDDGKLSAQYEYTILLTETGYEILSK